MPDFDASTISGNFSAPNPQDIYPNQSVGGQEWGRTEPLLTPDLLVQRFLLGVPLRSRVKNPVTGKYDVYTPEILRDRILNAVAEAEIMTGVPVFPTTFDESIPFDRVEFNEFGYFILRNRPVLKINKIAIRPPNNVTATDIWIVPPEWISFGDGAKGRINVVPLVAGNSMLTYQAQTTGGAAFLLSFLSGAPFIPSFWMVNYIAGFPEGNCPRVLNQLLGCIATIDILSGLGATNVNNSYSLSMDSMSQSTSSQGPNVYSQRIKELSETRDKLVQKFRAIYGVKLALGHV